MSLRSFSVTAALGKHAGGFDRRPRSTAPQVTRPIVLALAAMAVKCARLENITVGPPIRCQDSDECGCCTNTRGWHDQVLTLKDVPGYLRGDRVLEEADAIFTRMTCVVEL